MPPHSGGLVLAHFVEPVMLLLKRLKDPAPNGKTDQAKTSSRPRYSARNLFFCQLLLAAFFKLGLIIEHS